jgi:uncharacterized membrane protein
VARLTALQAPADVVHAAGESIGAAVNAAGPLAEPLRTSVVSAARAEFVDAFSSSLLLGAAVILIAAAVAFWFLPARAEDAREPVADAVDGLASLTFAEAQGLLEATMDGIQPDDRQPAHGLLESRAV